MLLVVKKRGPRKNFVQDLIAQQSPFMDKQKIAEATKKQKLKLERFQILGIVTLFNVIVSHLFAKHVFSTVIQSCPERKIVFFPHVFCCSYTWSSSQPGLCSRFLCKGFPTDSDGFKLL